MKRIIISIFILFSILCNTFIWAAEPLVTAPSAILIDSKSGKILYGKNANAKMYPASTTKVMTGLLAAEHGKFDDLITIGEGPTHIERGSSQIYLIPGEQLTLEQLFYAMMLESANDAAVAIAEHISGTVPDFANLMNERAKALGANNTHFVNPNGLHNDNHYTTANDLALIARQGMTLPKFREVVSTVKYTIPKTNKQEERNYITNGNKLIWKSWDKYRYEYAIGVKTGYTVKSKHCLVSSAKKGDMELIAVVLGAEGTNMYTDSKALFEYGFANFKNVNLLQKNQIVTTVTVADKSQKINLLAADNFDIMLKNNENDRISHTLEINQTIKSPIKKGDKLGTITYSLDKKVLKKIDLTAAEEVLPTKIIIAKKSWKKWLLGLVIIFLIYRTIVTALKEIKKKKKKGLTFIKR